MADPQAPDCLTSLIGLSDGALPCFPLPADPDKAAAATASMTGWYVSDAPGLKLAPGPNATAAADMYERLAQARKLAVGAMRMELQAGRAKSVGTPLFQERGTLGSDGAGVLMPAGTRALFTFPTSFQRAGGWRVTALNLYTNVAVADVALQLDGVEVARLNSTGAKGGTTGLPVGGLPIPLDGRTHTLEVLLPDGVRVYQNKVYCFGCNAGSPWALTVKRCVPGWDSSTLANGLSMTVKEECTVGGDLLCFATGSDDVDGPAATADASRYPELVKHMGFTLLFKAAEYFTDGLLASNATNRYTMLEPKMLVELSAGYAAEYATRLAWLNSPGGLGQVQHPCYAPPAYRGPSSQWTG